MIDSNTLAAPSTAAPRRPDEPIVRELSEAFRYLKFPESPACLLPIEAVPPGIVKLEGETEEPPLEVIQARIMKWMYRLMHHEDEEAQEVAWRALLLQISKDPTVRRYFRQFMEISPVKWG